MFLPSRRRLACLVSGIAALSFVLTTAPVLEAPALADDPGTSVASSPDVMTADGAVAAMVSARASGHPVEDISQRTDETRVYANPDGSWTSDSAPEPTEVQGTNDAWHDIDTTLVATDGGFKPKWADSDLVLSAGGDNVFATMTVDGKQLDWHWAGKLPVPVISGDTATYANAVPGGGDLVVTATSTGFTHDIVLNKAPKGAGTPAGVVWHLPVVTHGDHLTGTSTGGMEIKSASGKPLLAAPEPLMYDSSTDASGGPQAVPVDATVGTTSSGTPAMTLSPDSSFLTDPSTVYPVTIDPSFTAVTTADTWVENTDLTTSQNTDAGLTVGTKDAGTHKARAFMKFANGPWVGKDVTAASLVLNNISSPSCTASDIRVLPISEDWTVANLTWANEPAANGNPASYTPAHGGGSNCPPYPATWDVTSFVKSWAADTSTNHGLRVKAADETDSNSWRRYRSVDFGDPSVAPRLRITYNTPPATPSNLKVTPSTSYAPAGGTASAYTASGKPKVSATVSDPDGGTVRALVQFFTSKTGSAVASCTTGYVASGGTASCTPSTALADGTYYVRAQAQDGTDNSKAWSSWSQVSVDTTAPPTPSISCDSAADGSWSPTVPQAKPQCTITAGGTGLAAPVKVNYTLDGITKTTTNATTTVAVAATNGGHSITATSDNAAGVASSGASYGFGYGDVGMSEPAASPLTQTSGTVAIAASGPPQAGSTPTAYLEWRLAGSGGDEATGWTKDDQTQLDVTSAPDGGLSITGTWDTTTATHDQGTNTDLDPKLPNLLDVQVCVDYTSITKCTGDTDPTQVLRVAHAFGGNFPTTSVPGGQVALWTGEFESDATDADLSAGTTDLSVSRTASTYAGPAVNPADNVFGPGWVANLDGPSFGYAGDQVIDDTRTQGVIAVLDGQGDAMVFAHSGNGTLSGNPKPVQRTGADLATGAWLPLDPATAEAGTSAKITGSGAATTLTLTDPDGTTTTFGVTAAPDATHDAVFHALSAKQATSNSTVSYTYENLGGAQVVKRILGPTTATCPVTLKLPAGCRALELDYYGDSDVSASAPSSGQDGYSAGRLATISTLVGSGDGSTAATPTVTALYRYDSAGRLASVTDPRPTQGALTTSYAYGTGLNENNPVLTQLTPPGQTPVNYTYDSAGKLTQVTRNRPGSDDPTGTADLATIAYGIPVNGTLATTAGLPDLSDTNVATWDQPAGPTYGAAVFGPDHPLSLSGGDVGTLTGSDWQYASLAYTDAEGNQTNTADYGTGRWLLTDTEYDTHDNPIRDLSTADIAAVQDGTLEAQDAGAITVYNPERDDASGNVTLPADTETTDTYDTARYVQLAGDPAGTLTLVRPHTHTDYDQGAPNGDTNPATGQAYALPTTTTTGAVAAGIVDRNGGDGNGDLETDSIVKTGYDNAVPGAGADAGWNMALPSANTTVMNDTVTGGTSGAAPIVAKTGYNADGQVISTSQPMSNGNDAGTRQSIYYTAGTDSSVGAGASGSTPNVSACDGRPEWAGLLCQTKFAGNPASGPAMITTTYSYNQLQETTQTTETSGGTTRTTTTGYDPAGRQTSTATAVTGLPNSTALPTVTYGYDAATGLPTTTTPTTGEGGPINVGYDAWGRQKSYTTSTGTTTSTYDTAGELASTSTPDGTTTSYTYDGTDAAGNTERRGLVTSQTATKNSISNTITAAYDPAGNTTVQDLGAGIKVDDTYDPAGQFTARSYTGDLTTTDDSGNTTTAHDQAWLGWTQDYNTLGQIVTDWTPDGAATGGDTTGTAATGYARAYTYDPADRLTQVLDHTTTAGASGLNPDGTPTDTSGETTASCVTRSYTYDADGNRTSATTTPPAADGTCQTTGGTPHAWSHDPNDSDRITNTGYVNAYDNLGRVIDLPQADTPEGSAYTAGGSTRTAPGDLTLSYYDDDTVHMLTQNNQTTTYDLDAAGRPLTETTGPSGGAATSTTTLGYRDASDSPGWETTNTGSSSAAESYIAGPDGNLASTLTTTAGATSVQLALNDPHGDTVAQATLPTTGNAAGIDDWQTTDEYGNPLGAAASNPAATASNPGGQTATGGNGGLGYGWTGAKQRATLNAGLVLMGARLYDSVNGQFTTLDPTYGGNPTPYAYPEDPVGAYDLNGYHWWSKAASDAIGFMSIRGTIDGVVDLARGHGEKGTKEIASSWFGSKVGFHLNSLKDAWGLVGKRGAYSLGALGGKLALRGTARVFGWEGTLVATAIDYGYTYRHQIATALRHSRSRYE